MEVPRLRCVVKVADGPSRRVGASGLLVGRQRDCDIVTPDPAASRRHALVRLTAEGAEVVPLGRAPVEVNGAAMDTAVALADGDELRVPGVVLHVSIELPGPSAARRPATSSSAMAVAASGSPTARSSSAAAMRTT